ncbi:methyltransferase domain-containing protein [Roseiconus lacunae]|uniref:Methyltransferase domain-containing protein n=1 Tax=Roseiconus lacunae TaxID=2605694 RepID=A0ABT7PIZ5_9BACT|nr:methyltransferase domain-containing protein [Roseiconus lacunae]MDM4016470.1 methyltransferase domain-containing protein [Roseiconus lacunae]
MNWNAGHYLRYGNERTRAAVDLAARIRLDLPEKVVDLGCGPGNSTQVLRQRWMNSEIIGIDNSPEMIAAARKAFPDENWQLADVACWTPASAFDLVYSNAMLQWMPDHANLIPVLFGMVAPGGALAFQIPSGTYAVVRTLIHEISHKPEWTDQLEAARTMLTMESPSFYYDVLAAEASEIDIWETEYCHVMDSPNAIVDWIASTGLSPFLAALASDDQRAEFVSELKRRVYGSYETRVDGKILFDFRRTFVIAYR